MPGSWANPVPNERRLATGWMSSWSLARRSLARYAAAGLAMTVVGCGPASQNRASETPGRTSVPPIPQPPPSASPIPGYLDPRRWAGRTVTVASQGGDYQDAQTAAIFDPFAAATGARVQQKSATDLGALRQQVDQGSVTWDLADVPTDEVLPLARANYLTPVDYQKVDRTPLFESVALQHAVGAAFFSTVLVYSIAASHPPSGWVDFWHVDRFPGGRSLRRSPIGTLEFALMADGVRAGDLYPLDIGRAFASLDKIRPFITEWYDNARQPVALVLTGDVTMASSYNVLAEATDARSSLRIQWNGGMLSADSWVIPRGAQNVDVAMDLINFATRAIPSANFSRLVPFGPVNRNAFGLLEPGRLALLPNTDPHRAEQFLQNWNWWADNRESVIKRFDDWFLAEPTPDPAVGTSAVPS